MKAALAERLLAEVMKWTAEDVARERPILQVLADLKYDSYQQFSPGMRFVESLALWLAQFSNLRERLDAYQFVREHLIFLSSAEMDHFASMAYPDIIRPMLVEQAAVSGGLPPFKLGEILGSEAYSKLRESTLVFGLSDGARVDFFRRSNRSLSHEQVFQSPELSPEKFEELRLRLESLGNAPPCGAVILLDDFTASGTSYFRCEGDDYKGKIARFLQRVSQEPWDRIVRLPDTKVMVVVYVATEVAMERINSGVAQFSSDAGEWFRAVAVQHIPPNVSLSRNDLNPIVPLVKGYYDPCLENEHTRKGGTDLKFGFSEGGLPLILHHNSPNNSLFLLWAEDECSVRGLFPRVSRHRSEQ